jgi:hypothetical protein
LRKVGGILVLDLRPRWHGKQYKHKNDFHQVGQRSSRYDLHGRDYHAQRLSAEMDMKD